MKKKVIYRENGERKFKLFDVAGKRMCDGLRVDAKTETASIVFAKSVDYLGSVYVETENDK